MRAFSGLSVPKLQSVEGLIDQRHLPRDTAAGALTQRRPTWRSIAAHRVDNVVQRFGRQITADIIQHLFVLAHLQVFATAP